MNRTRCAILSALLSAAASGAFADPITVTAGAPGSVSPEYAGATLVNIDALAPGALPYYFFDGGGPNGAVTLTGTGAVENTSLLNAYAQPAGTTGNYLTVSGTTAVGAVSFAFSAAENYFGIYWGSIDAYNTVSFFNQGEEVAIYSGDAIATLTGLAPSGNWTDTSANRYINFYTGNNFFDTVVLSTSNFGFEVANIAYGDPPIPAAVPEPSSLVLLGSAMSTLALIRRKRARRRALSIICALPRTRLG